MELSQGEYSPIRAAYPILFPGLWSLVYQSQETTEVWIVAKASLSIAPFLLILMASISALRGRPIMAFLSALVTVLLLFRDFDPQTIYLTSGHMDWPVAIFSMMGAGLLIRACVTSALAAITKQPGALILVCSIALVIILTLFRKVNWKQGGFFVLIAVAPMLSILGLYNVNKIGSIMGNIDQLTSLAERERGAEQLLSSYELLIGPLPIAFVILSTLSILFVLILSKGWVRISFIIITFAEDERFRLLRVAN